MKHPFKVGLSFGLTSGIITTLGLVVGLSAATNSQVVVLGGILTIALADAFSDAFGIHVSEESENKHSSKEVWQATLATFFSKLVFASTFLAPVLLFDLPTAIMASIAWGLLLLTALSVFIARQGNAKTLNVVAEHLLIAVVVIIATNLAGNWVSVVFG